jgi:hypothetical protein
LDHRYDDPMLDARVLVLPPQILTVPAGVMVGLDGSGLISTSVGMDVL